MKGLFYFICLGFLCSPSFPAYAHKKTEIDYGSVIQAELGYFTGGLPKDNKWISLPTTVVAVGFQKIKGETFIICVRQEDFASWERGYNEGTYFVSLTKAERGFISRPRRRASLPELQNEDLHIGLRP